MCSTITSSQHVPMPQKLHPSKPIMRSLHQWSPLPPSPCFLRLHRWLIISIRWRVPAMGLTRFPVTHPLRC